MRKNEHSQLIDPFPFKNVLTYPRNLQAVLATGVFECGFGKAATHSFPRFLLAFADLD